MMNKRRYDWRWLSGMLMLLLLLTACSKSSQEDVEREKPALKIYIFPPDHPMVTRADNGDVPASEAENWIGILHVWVFENHQEETDPKHEDDGKYVGYVRLDLRDEDISQSGRTVSMELNESFANAENKPNVDVYVAANVSAANSGITLNATTTRAQLGAALIGEKHFGVNPLIKEISENEGLPMSGVMKNKAVTVTGTPSVFQVSEESGSLANVKLVRAVSKIRFVSCMSLTNKDEVTINSIKLDNDVLPTTEYLFLNNAYDLEATQKWKVGTDYVTAAPEDLTGTTMISAVTDIKRNASPTSFSYKNGMTGQQYEDKIQKGIDDEELTDLGTFYLRESDKRLAGTINYTIKHKNNPEDENEVPATITNTLSFSMKDAGDFSRNHTWIVYSYFISNGDLIMGMVETTDWETGEPTTQFVYNW